MNTRQIVSRWVPQSLFGRLLFVGLAGCCLLSILTIFDLRLRPDNHYRRTIFAIESRLLTACLLPALRASPRVRERLLPHIEQEGVMRISQSGSPLPLLHTERDDDFETHLQCYLGELDIRPQVLQGGIQLMAGNARQAGLAEIVLQLDDGSWLRVEHSIERLPETSRPLWRSLLLRLPLESLLVLLLALVSVFWIVRPLHALMRAAEAMGHNLEAPPLREDRGPREIRETARAFNTMCTRLRTFLKQRAFVFAAISHDLRTPLTRLCLRLESVADEGLREQLRNDACNVQQMLDEAIRVVRATQTGKAEEAEDLVDVMALVQSVVENRQDLGQNVTLAGSVSDVLRLPPATFRHCLDNLIGNAVRYAGGADVRLQREAKRLRIDVLDNGPGIPEEEQEKVFEPFYRLDRSRNPNMGGHGLGLAIARAAALQCGGDVSLCNRSEGGLCASVWIPLNR